MIHGVFVSYFVLKYRRHGSQRCPSRHWSRIQEGKEVLPPPKSWPDKDQFG